MSHAAATLVGPGSPYPPPTPFSTGYLGKPLQVVAAWTGGQDRVDEVRSAPSEKGRAPDAITASQPGKAAASNVVIPTGGSEAATLKGTSISAALIVQSRPVYPYPYMAAYDGQGDPAQAASYVCGAALSFELPKWAGADFYRPYKPHEPR